MDAATVVVLSLTNSADEVVVAVADADQRVGRRSDVVMCTVTAFERAPAPAGRRSDAAVRA